MPTDNIIPIVRYVLLALGVCLLVAGALLLLWFGLLVQKILMTPGEVQLIEYVAAHIGPDEPLLSGVVAGESFRVKISETGRTFGFFLLGLIALSILAGIVKALVVGGVEIIKGAAAIAVGTPAGEGGKGQRGVHVHGPASR